MICGMWSDTSFLRAQERAYKHAFRAGRVAKLSDRLDGQQCSCIASLPRPVPVCPLHNIPVLMSAVCMQGWCCLCSAMGCWMPGCCFQRGHPFTLTSTPDLGHKGVEALSFSPSQGALERACTIRRVFICLIVDNIDEMWARVSEHIYAHLYV